jgi:DNA-binding transcriptional MerR regulator
MPKSAAPSCCLTSEAARLLGVCADTARRWADTGRVSVRLTGSGLRVYDRVELERLAAERAAKAK